MESKALQSLELDGRVLTVRGGANRIGRKGPMTQRVSKEELLAKANKPAEDAMKLHAFYRGKMQTVPRCHIRSFADFACYYSPGVAAPCRAIQADESRVNEFTGRWNTIAVVTDGTSVPRQAIP
jgi:malic enzyme